MYTVNKLSKSNCNAIAELAIKLWPDASFDEELAYFSNAVDDTTKTAFLISQNSINIGFVFVALRTDYVEGTKTSPVCYIEGIYVEPEFRYKGIAKILINEAEKWGKLNRCTEIASDAQIDNLASIGFHKSIGFKEINQIVCFAKIINPS